MPKVTILEEEPGIAGYTIFTLNEQSRRDPLNIIDRKDPLPEAPRQWQKGDRVEIPGLGRDNTVTGPGKRPGESMVRIGDLGPYSIPDRAMHRRRPNIKRTRSGSPRRSVFDYSETNGANWLQ